MENQGSVNLKPNKPEPYDGRRDCLVVNTWLYKVEKYLVLAGIANPAVPLNDANQILFASTFLTGTAAVWWYTLVQSGQTPTTWNEFKAAMVEEFVPEHHVRRARERLRKLKQTHSVSKYLSDFRNMVLTIPDITEEEKFVKFCSELRYEVRLEVIKSTATTFNEAARIALRVDSALWAAGNFTGFSAGSGSGSNIPTPMEIGNIEKSGGR